MVLAAVVTFANSLGNGFALDDNWFIVENEVVTEGRYSEALTLASWPGALEGTGNWRPLALSSFATEWALWGAAPFGYHLVSVLTYAVVCLLAFLVLRTLVGVVPAGVGAGFFAVHPVHVEAVANVMGRSELYAGVGFFAACLVYLRWRPEAPAARGARVLALLALYGLAVAGKEIAVTLPAVLMALELLRPASTPVRARVRDQALTWVALFAFLGCYVLIRWTVLGDFTGESAAAGLRSLDTRGRLLTALTVWPHYVRLLFVPLDLSADYSPAVLSMTDQVDAMVLLGGGILLVVAGSVVALWNRRPLVALACAWFVITISPVSNLIVRSDILLAERTLFLPSFAAALAVALLTAHLFAPARSPAVRRRSAVLLAVIGLLLAIRSVDRNPSWRDTFTVLATLNEDHPESWMAWRLRASGLARVGETTAAAEAWETALTIAPDHYQLLVDAAEFHEQTGRPDRSEELLARAVRLLPRHPAAYRRLAEYRILRGEGRAAHAAAVEGVRSARNDNEIWALLSESYVMKGDLEAAVRARTASIAARETVAGLQRLAELYEALDRGPDAAEARRRAARAGQG